MARKYFTLIVVPDATAQFKQFKISYWLLRGAIGGGIMIVLGLAGISYYLVTQYAKMDEVVTQLPSTRQQTWDQKVLLERYEQDITNLRQMVSRLKLVNAKLMLMAGVENPLNPTVSFGMGGAESENGVTEVVAGFQQETERTLTKKLDTLVNLKNTAEDQEELSQRLMEFFQDQQGVLASTPSVWPVRGWVTSGFGSRKSPFTARRTMHSGIDISTKTGTPMKAPADGIVAYADVKGAYGNVLVIDHGNGFNTFYGHCSKLLKKVGDRVKRGDIIAAVGNTGRSTGSHLHYEVRVNGVATNPTKYILDL